MFEDAHAKGPAKDQFELGRLVATPAALELLHHLGVNPLSLVGRHLSGDWGELDPEDVRANEAAVRMGNRVVSAYTLGEEKARVWIITEWDRSYTTIFLPQEY